MRKLHYHIGKGKVACGASVRRDPADPAYTADPLKVTCESCKRSRDVNAMLLRDKVTTYEALLHHIHFARAVAMDGKRVGELLDLISDWSYAHRVGNGEYSDQEQAAVVAKKYEKLRL